MRTNNFLDLALWTGGTPQIVKLANCPQHGGHRNPAHAITEALVRSNTIMDIEV